LTRMPYSPQGGPIGILANRVAKFPPPEAIVQYEGSRTIGPHAYPEPARCGDALEHRTWKVVDLVSPLGDRQRFDSRLVQSIVHCNIGRLCPRCVRTANALRMSGHVL